MIKFRWETQFQKTELGEIPREWGVSRVRDVARTNEKSINRNFPHKEIEYIDINSVKEGELLEVKKIPLSAAPSRAKRMVREGDILISTVRPNLKHYLFVKKARENTIASTGFVVVTPHSADPRYLYYVLTTESTTEYLTIIAGTHTSAYPAFTPDVLENMKIPLPPPDEQRRIAAVLSWFDDLIENKKRQNEILENTAMALFKSWFVDFEPFQDEEFVYNEELGREVPRGWAVRPIGEVAKVIMGQSPPSKYYNENGEGLPFIQGKGQMGEIIPSTTVYCSKNIKMARAHDILVTVRAPVGELNIAERDYIIGRGIAGLRSKYWVFLYLHLQMDKERLKSYERGTTYDAITKEEIESFPLLLPPEPVLQRFHEMVEPLFRKIINNEKEIMVLKKARDALLPLLVFGKLRVEEI